MSEYISRIITPKVEEAGRYFPVIVITGPRQSGKTSLCRHLYPDYRYANLENITMRAVASEDPAGFLDSLGEAAIIDEVQHVPELLSMIQVRVDENRGLKYVLTGSSNFALLQSVSQSLAGRAALLTLLPFSFKEIKGKVENESVETIMWRGEYPGVIVNDIPPLLFYQNYYNTYVERDLRDLLKLRNLLSFDKFMRLLASRTGSEFNASGIAKEVGVTAPTITEWLSLLATSYIVFPLAPYFTNIAKRLTKMPKVYFYDTGLLCYLLGIEDSSQLRNHPLRGAIFENLAIVELIKGRYNAGLNPNIYFYRERSGKEVDALIAAPDGLNLYEVKSGKTLRPDYLANMKALAEEISQVKSSTIIYDGENIPPVAVNIREI